MHLIIFLSDIWMLFARVDIGRDGVLLQTGAGVEGNRLGEGAGVAIAIDRRSRGVFDPDPDSDCDSDSSQPA